MAIYGSAHGQSAPIGAIGPPGMKRECRKNVRKMEAERGISIRSAQAIPLSPALANNLSASHRNNNDAHAAHRERNSSIYRHACGTYQRYIHSMNIQIVFDISPLDRNCDIDLTYPYPISNGKPITPLSFFFTAAAINVRDDRFSH